MTPLITRNHTIHTYGICTYMYINSALLMLKNVTRGIPRKYCQFRACGNQNQQSNQLENSLLEKSKHFIDKTKKAQLFTQ